MPGQQRQVRTEPFQTRPRSRTLPEPQWAAIPSAPLLAERARVLRLRDGRFQRQVRSDRQQRRAQGIGERPRNRARRIALSERGTRPAGSAGAGSHGNQAKRPRPIRGAAAIFLIVGGELRARLALRLAPAPRRRRTERRSAETGAMLNHEGGATVQNIIVGDKELVGEIVDRLSATEAAQSAGLVVAAGNDAEQAAHDSFPAGNRRAR